MSLIRITQLTCYIAFFECLFHFASTLPQSDKSDNEARFFGMKEEDFNWVVDHMKIFRQEMAKRKNLANAVEQDKSVVQPHQLRASYNSTNLNTNQSLITFDDVMFNKPQLQFILNYYGIGKTKRRRKRKVVNFETFPSRMWPMPIKYKMQSGSSGQFERIFDDAVTEWMKQTCVVFEKHDYEDFISEQHLLVNPYAGDCSSFIGMLDKTSNFPQYLNMQDSMCFEMFGTPLHEIGHALGLYHEHLRPDRDANIQILWDNVRMWEENIEYMLSANWIDAQTYDVPYDLGSVMHNRATMAKEYYDEGRDFFTPLDPSLKSVMGQRMELSFYDVKIINLVYCSDVCNSAKKLPCTNGGYIDPKNCSRCRCPDGWGGILCDKLEKGSSTCSPKSQVFYLTPSSAVQCVQSPNYVATGYIMDTFIPDLSCTWKLKGPANYSIYMWFTGANFGLLQQLDVCQHWVEIRHQKNHTVRGQRFCGTEKPPYSADQPLVSNTNEVTILYHLAAMRGQNTLDYYSGFQLCFRTVVSHCSSQPCLNGGTCIEIKFSFQCQCKLNFMGPRCEQAILSSAVRLRRYNGLVNSFEGRLEIFYNNAWGTVCSWNNNFFSRIEARVVCRQLGMQGGEVMYDTYFGDEEMPIWIHGVICNGYETKLMDCPHWMDNRDFSCNHNNDVGVICESSPCLNEPCFNGGVCEPNGNDFACNCAVGWYGDFCELVDKRTIRLVRGSNNTNSYEGRLEIFYFNKWGTVCDDGFTTSNAIVVCRQLGYKGGIMLASTQVKDGSGPIWLDNVACTGNENNLDECTHLPYGTTDCTHAEDVGVRCARNCLFHSCQNNGTCLSYNPSSYICICPASYYGTDCEYFDFCFYQPCLNGGRCVREFDYYICNCPISSYGQNCEISDPCRSNPCQYGSCYNINGDTSYNCTCWNEYMGRNCDIAIPSPQCAREQLFCYNNGTCIDILYSASYCLCQPGFTNYDCSITDACSSNPCLNGHCSNTNDGLSYNCSCDFGYAGLNCQTVLSCSQSQLTCNNNGVCIDSSSAPPYCSCHTGFKGFNCSIADACMSNPCYGGYCTNTNGGISYNCTCYDGVFRTNCETGDKYKIRLRDGANQYEGRLEVFHNGSWGTVCDDNFDTQDAIVACKQLGYTGGIPLYSNEVIDGMGEILLDELTCVGEEDSLFNCQHSPYGFHDCLHEEDVGVKCTRIPSNDTEVITTRMPTTARTTTANPCARNPCGSGTCLTMPSGFACRCSSGRVQYTAC